MVKERPYHSWKRTRALARDSMWLVFFGHQLLRDLIEGRFGGGWWAADGLYCAFWIRLLVRDAESERTHEIPGAIVAVLALFAIEIYRTTK
jgi:hypothetical protein